MHRPAVLGVVLAALLAAPSADAAVPKRRCRPPASGVVARSGSNVLFMRATGPDDGEYGPPHALFGCWSARHLPRRLLTVPEGSTVVFAPLGADGARARFAGHFAAFAVAFDSTICDKYAQTGCTSSSVGSVSLRTGRWRASAASGASAADMVLTVAGWFAWLPAGSSSPPLLAVDSGGQRTLDPGPVDAGSLTATAAGVAWTHAGAAQTAPLS